MKDGKKILVVGSMNTDMVVNARRIPLAGETILGGKFAKYYGGKGANQAVAAKTLYEDTAFCAGAGDDVLSREYLDSLSARGLDLSLVKTFADSLGGVALITVDENGQNAITVAPGANMMLSPADMRAIDFSKFSHIAFQLENDMATVEEGLKCAKQAGCFTILTPAPAQRLSDEILANVDCMVPNEFEVLQIAGVDTNMESAAVAMLKKGVKNVVATLGSRGCAHFCTSGRTDYAARKVNAVDTVGAGDCFTGSLMAGLKRFDGDFERAIRLASSAAALAVTMAGAQNLASSDAVEKFLNSK